METGFDWSPRRLSVRGQPFAGGEVDVEVVLSGGRAESRDRDATEVREVGEGLFFPADGSLPVAFHEQLVAYWRTRGRPAEIASAPGGPIRIQSRANQQIDVAGRTVMLERLSIEGPVWGSQTAWVEPGGRLDALATWVGGLPLEAVREGFESRLAYFADQAVQDRLMDLGRLTSSNLTEYPSGVVFTGATVIVSPARPPMTDATVVVRDGRIAAVGPSTRVSPPAGLPVIDAQGLTIAAGLWDLDGQMSQIEGATAYLAAGVTTVRHTSLDGTFASALRVDAAARSRGLLGPRMLQAGPIHGVGADALGAVRVETPDQAREWVRRYRNDGIRRIETGPSVSGPVLEAIVREAHRLGLTVGGRVADGAAAAQAAQAGLDLIEAPAAIGDGAGEPTWLAALAREGTFFAPEAAWHELRNAGSVERLAEPWLPAGLQLPRSLVRRYARISSPGGAPGATFQTLIAAAHRAGVRLVPGTGPGIPGLGVVRELELLVEAGLTPADALQAGTVDAAELMKLDDGGTVESGKRADLIVLAANPLDDISNLRTVRWVVVDGKVYEAATLWALAGFGN